jgi:hypothetical protein
MTSPDTKLSTLLGEWRESPELDPGFRREVWARIESRRAASPGPGWFSLLSSPRFAVTASVIAVFAGMVAGNLQARSAGETLYLRSLDPLSLHVHTR